MATVPTFCFKKITSSWPCHFKCAGDFSLINDMQSWHPYPNIITQKCCPSDEGTPGTI